MKLDVTHITSVRFGRCNRYLTTGGGAVRIVQSDELLPHPVDVGLHEERI